MCLLSNGGFDLDCYMRFVYMADLKICDNFNCIYHITSNKLFPLKKKYYYGS